MSETITLKEIACIVKVSPKEVSQLFERGKYLEYVPRPIGPSSSWKIYRKDFESAIEKKNQQLTKEYSLWDDLFQIDTIALD